MQPNVYGEDVVGAVYVAGMRIVVSELITADHQEVRGLIHEGFHGVGKDAVEVHVVTNGSRFAISGRAWPELPKSRPVAPGTHYLVQIEMPRRPSGKGYPFVWRYPRLKTPPELRARDWRERLLAVAAHEAYHVKQFRSGMRRSEVTAERWAERMLADYRDGSSTVGAATNGRVRSK